MNASPCQLTQLTLGLVLVFSDLPISVSEPILVATALLFWDPEYSDVKLIQTILLTQELRRIMASVPIHLRPSHTTSQHVPMVLADDFNSPPDSAGKHRASNFMDMIKRAKLIIMSGVLSFLVVHGRVKEPNINGRSW